MLKSSERSDFLCPWRLASWKDSSAWQTVSVCFWEHLLIIFSSFSHHLILCSSANCLQKTCNLSNMERSRIVRYGLLQRLPLGSYIKSHHCTRTCDFHRFSICKFYSSQSLACRPTGFFCGFTCVPAWFSTSKLLLQLLIAATDDLALAACCLLSGFWPACHLGFCGIKSPDSQYSTAVCLFCIVFFVSVYAFWNCLDESLWLGIHISEWFWSNRQGPSSSLSAISSLCCWFYIRF